MYSVKMPSRWGTIVASRERDDQGTFFRRRNNGVFSRDDDGVRLRKRGVDNTVNDYIDLFCRAVTVPEGRLDVVQANGHEHMGITRETAQNFIYGKPLMMTFIENSDFTIYKAMRKWIEATGVGDRINQQRVRTLRMNYYNSYIGDIEIIKYEFPNQTQVDRAIRNGRLQYSGYKTPIAWTFKNAYPIQVGRIDLQSDSYNTATEFDVHFTYESYSVSDPLRRDSRYD